MLKIFFIQLIMSVIGTLGFAILFKLRPRYLAPVSVIGGCCYAVYYLFASVLATDVFIAALVSTVFVASSAELLARISHSPALIFLLPSLIPIVPGSSLYNMMQSLITKKESEALFYGVEAIKIAMGIAGGIVIVSVLVNIGVGIYERIRKNEK